MATASSRLSYLDMARAGAILLAMTSHIFQHLEIWRAIDPDAYRVFKMLTRTATPTFIILFGIMLELVYVKYAQRGDMHAASRRLLKRSLMCYLCFGMVAFAALIGGHVDMERFLQSIVFADKARYGEILKYYVFALAVAPGLLMCRLRWGLKSLLLILALIWLYDLLLAVPLESSVIGGHYSSSLILGVGNLHGPSMLHGMSFVLVGMILGRLITTPKDSREYRQHQWAFISLVLLSAVIFFSSIFQQGFIYVVDNITTFHREITQDFRRNNMPTYYAYGLLACALWVVFYWLIERYKPQLFSRAVRLFGIESLFAYTFGNVLINSLPKVAEGTGLSFKFVYAGLFLLALYLCCWGWHLAKKRGWVYIPFLSHAPGKT